ncbi:hypothetical protein CTI12_AA068400 [Artemisia annua]|uniref:Uncharacterized protein n=1 Tax=Artemisia annua TaxID=35608 RepID=A0A2U1Q6Q2_ARTAN|nr:hypothetical protein CTI12_AA068400 [Artemisia annua]
MGDNHHPYGILKRKDRPPSYKGSETYNKKMMTSSSSSKMLAGYMAYEFLTKGSVLGRKVDKKTEQKANETSMSKIIPLPIGNISNNNNTQFLLEQSMEKMKGRQSHPYPKVKKLLSERLPTTIGNISVE